MLTGNIRVRCLERPALGPRGYKQAAKGRINLKRVMLEMTAWPVALNIARHQITRKR